ncbi:MAG: GTP cyclohydrolase I FolE [Flavobacteriales bacterium]|nr:GTP cyclohydrolase I FolE [Flavobacteriales bacterium]
MRTNGTVLELNSHPRTSSELLEGLLPDELKRVATPMHAGAFSLTEEERITRIAHHFGEIMHTLGLDLTDDSLKDTPQRVAKMYVQEVFGGLDPQKRPTPTLFDNTYAYTGMLVETGIRVHSFCEHHLVPIIGKASVAYHSSGKVIGLSKLNRIVHYYASRPQVQERLTEQIAAELKQVLRTEDVAVLIEAEHMCVKLRGVKDEDSLTTTVHYGGRFAEGPARSEFLAYLHKQ